MGFCAEKSSMEGRKSLISEHATPLPRESLNRIEQIQFA